MSSFFFLYISTSSLYFSSCFPFTFSLLISVSPQLFFLCRHSSFLFLLTLSTLLCFSPFLFSFLLLQLFLHSPCPYVRSVCPACLSVFMFYLSFLTTTIHTKPENKRLKHRNFLYSAVLLLLSVRPSYLRFREHCINIIAFYRIIAPFSFYPFSSISYFC